MCLFYLILWLCHIDLLMRWMGTQNEDRVTLLIYRSDFFQNGRLTHQSDGFLRSSKSHALIVFMFIWILSPLCDSLLPPHRAQELYTSWMTTVCQFYFLCCQFTVKQQYMFLQVTNSKYLQDINDFAVCQVCVLYSVTDSWVPRQIK